MDAASTQARTPLNWQVVKLNAHKTEPALTHFGLHVPTSAAVGCWPLS